MAAEPSIGIEPLSEELVKAYEASGMERGKAGIADIKWTFRSNPQPFAVARVGGRIVGVSAYIKNKMLFGNSAGSAVQAVDSFVFEEARGQRVFSKLATAYDEFAGNEGIDLVWGFPNDNAAPAWFGKLGWRKYGQVPFLFKPLRTGFITRRFGLPTDFRVSRTTDHNIDPVDQIGEWGDVIWEKLARQIDVGVVRDRDFLNHRIFDGPQASQYRTVLAGPPSDPAFVTSREAAKHGAKVAYIMEAAGGSSLRSLLESELGRLTSRGMEVALAWCYPWSPNYKVYRKAGFFPLPERIRPTSIWFGSIAKSDVAKSASTLDGWYLSYLDSDTI